MRGHFDWLSGKVEIAASMPVGLDGNPGLVEYYRHPNDQRWGALLPRVLFHESLHFWQLLGSRYLADFVGEEWSRLRDFEKTGIVPPEGRIASEWLKKDDGLPFSTENLVEAIARFWDVHTRGVPTILAEGGMSRAKVRAFEGRYDPSAGTRTVRDGGFEFVMTRGGRYGWPYRWALATTEGDNRLAQIVFPIAGAAALGSTRPAALFAEVFKSALPAARDVIHARSTGFLNGDWTRLWEHVVQEIVGPIAYAMDLPRFALGLDSMHRGALADHPLYATYPARITDLRWSAILLREATPETAEAAFAQSQSDVIDAAIASPLPIFALPGQPVCRYLLGRAVPPPSIAFKDGVIYAPPPETPGAGHNNRRWTECVENVAARALAFRIAEQMATS